MTRIASTVSIVALTILALWFDELYCMPLLLPEDELVACNHSIYEGSLTRRRRSIPDFDAASPAYLEGSEAEQQLPAGQSSLTMDDVSGLFRGRKAPAPRHGPQRPLALASSDAALRGEAGVSGWLPMDEQEECYRQQGIEPPAQPQEAVRRVEVGWAGGAGPRAMPMVDGSQPRRPVARADEDHGDAFSLYSDAQRDSRLKKVNYPSLPGGLSELPMPGRVYKPLGVRPEFPVYDEDVDFRPDPLQGILDDRYWLEPGTREAVVRRYIDMARDNMMPYDLQVMKRETNNNPKEKNYKTGLKTGDEKCPCEEVVVACGSCSKGKGKKSNETEGVNEGISYGRKLLWLDYDEIPEVDERENEYEINEKEGDPKTQNNNAFPNSFGRKLLSFDRGEDDDFDVGEDKGTFDKPIAGRYLLSYSEDEGSYDDEDEDDENKEEYNNAREPMEEVASWDHMNEPYFERDETQTSRKGNKINPHFPDYSMVDSSKLIMRQENMVPMQNPVLDMSDKTQPGYYKPNKIANMLQKPLQGKPKGPRPSTINMNREFQAANEELFKNVSRYQATESSSPVTQAVSTILGATLTSVGAEKKRPQNEPKLKRNREITITKYITNDTTQQKLKRSPFGPQMSYSDELLGKVQPSGDEVHLFQGENDQNAGGGSLNNKSTPVNTTSSMLQSTQLNSSSSAPNNTYTDVTTLAPKVLKVNTKAKANDEEAVDAEVASDIVETVLSEYQRSSVIGHQIGVCRRNESLLNVKYGRIVPETEKVIKTVTDCIMDKLKAHLAKQSCILLEPELLQFLKWMVLHGESYKDYMQKVGEYSYLPSVTTMSPTCEMPDAAVAARTCEPEPMPPNPEVVSGSITSSSLMTSVSNRSF